METPRAERHIAKWLHAVYDWAEKHDYPIQLQRRPNQTWRVVLDVAPPNGIVELDYEPPGKKQLSDAFEVVAEYRDQIFTELSKAAQRAQQLQIYAYNGRLAAARA